MKGNKLHRNLPDCNLLTLHKTTTRICTFAGGGGEQKQKEEGGRGGGGGGTQIIVIYLD